MNLRIMMDRETSRHRACSSPGHHYQKFQMHSNQSLANYSSPPPRPLIIQVKFHLSVWRWSSSIICIRALKNLIAFSYASSSNPFQLIMVCRLTVHNVESILQKNLIDLSSSDLLLFAKLLKRPGITTLRLCVSPAEQEIGKPHTVMHF